MKKKFIAVYALIGVLALGSTTLTSCVDDNESASVTAVRDAKAAQLNALANYKNVQAQNEQILAEADAAIKEAEAEAQRIANELQDIELQKAQATLSVDLETLQAKAEAALLKQQAALEKAKADLIQASNSAEAAVQAKIDKLLASADAIMYGNASLWTYVIDNAFTTTSPDGTTITESYTGWQQSEYIFEAQSIAGLQKELITKRAEQIEVKYNLEDAKLALANALNEEKADSARNEALLKAYEENKTTSREDAQKELDAANQTITALQKAYQEADKIYTDANSKDLVAAVAKINATDVAEKLASTDYMNLVFDEDNDGTDEAWIDLNDYIGSAYPEDDMSYIEFTYDDGTAGQHQLSYSVMKDSLVAEELTAAIETLDLRITAAEAALEAAEEAETEDLKADNPTYKGYVDARDAAKKAYDANPQDPNWGYGTGYEYQEAQRALDSYVDRVHQAVEDAEHKVSTLEAEKKALTDFQTLMTGDAYKTYETVYAEYVEMEKTVAEKKIAVEKANYNITVQNNLVAALNQFLIDTEGFDWTALINQTKAAIVENKETIEKLNAGLGAITVDDESTTMAACEDAVDAIATQISRLESQIAQKQARYDYYMSEVEALINGETGLPEVPETPSTDTETPAEGEEAPAA